MNGKGSSLPSHEARTELSRREAAAEGRAEGLNVGWTVFSYLLSGMAAYGIIGWLVGRAVHVSLLFPIGMLVGLGISIGFIIYRYGKQGAVARASLSRGGLGGSTPRASTEGDDW
jgi:F0F1-type ATP synthase assembly protein I